MKILIKIFLISLFFFLTPFISKAAIIINEIFYNPEGVDTGSEYIRLFNNGDEAVDLTGWELDPSSAPYFTFPSFTLKSKKLVTIHINSSGVNTDEDLYDNGSGNMSNTEGPIALFNSSTHSQSTIIDYIEYGSGGQSNESKAVSAGIWTESDFINNVEEGLAIKLKTNNEDNNSSTDWEQTTPTIKLSSHENNSKESSPKPDSQIKISANEQPPIANAGDNIISFIDEEILFDGSNSYDPDGFELAYEWNLGEGGVKDDIIVTHKYSYPGTYLVSLMVFDGRYYNKDVITVKIYPKKVIINEFLPSPFGKDEEEEWVELYNDSDQITDISEWQLDDAENGSRPFVFPKNTLIAPKSYLVFSRKTTGIALNNEKDKVRLILSTGTVLQEVSYEKAQEGKSSARTPEGFTWSIPTPGLANIISYNNLSNRAQTLQSETTLDLYKNTNTYSNNNPSIKGGWTTNQNNVFDENQEKNYYNLANLKSNVDGPKTSLIIFTIIIFSIILGIIIIKRKNKS